MDPVEIVAEVLRTLNHLNIPYMLVGALSSNFYGEPRLTKDADFVVRLGSTALSALIESLGPDYHVDRQLGFETITATNRYLIEHIQAEFTIELFELTDDPHNQERFNRRREADFAGVPVFVATAEDVVIQKLRWYFRGHRPKDIEDAKNVLETQGAKLDMTYIRRWCDQHGTRELLEQTLQSIPPPAPA